MISESAPRCEEFTNFPGFGIATKPNPPSGNAVMLSPGGSELPTAALTSSTENPHAQISLETGAPLGELEEKSPFSQVGPFPPQARPTRLQAIFARAVLEVYI